MSFVSALFWETVAGLAVIAILALAATPRSVPATMEVLAP